MFWGLVLEPEKSYAQIVDTPFHLSMAALDLKNSDAQEEASALILRQDDVEYVLGNLSKKHKIFNLPLALDFDMGEEIEFAVQGSSQIHLTGFLADQDEIEADEDLEDEEEDENETENKIKEIKKAQAAKRKLNESDKSPGSTKKQRILDQSFNDDTDEDDFDITENDFGSDDDDEDSDAVEEEEEDDDDDDDEDEEDEEEEEVQLPKKQKQQQQVQTPESKQQKKQKQLQQQQSNKQGGQQQSNKQGQQQQQQQQQKNQKSPQKNQQANKTPQKGQQNKNQQNQQNQKTPQQGNKTPQGKQGKNPQQVNTTPEKKPAKKVVQGVVIEDIAEGEGKTAAANKMVGVHYVGRLANNKKEFDKTRGGEPFRFVLGRGEVIRGWDIGVSGMKVGGKRRLTIPANLAYGKGGAPPAIPPNSSLEFEVTLVSVK